MSANYEPGAVAVATVRGVPNVRVFRRYSPDTGICDWAYNPDPERGLNYSCDSDATNVVTDIRPLVVLDLAPALKHMSGGLGDLPEVLKDMRRGGGIFADRVADQIEAQTKPPCIPEPGLWGVVEANWESPGITGIPRAEWMRVKGNRWQSAISAVQVPWSELIDPVLVRPGIGDES